MNPKVSVRSLHITVIAFEGQLTGGEGASGLEIVLHDQLKETHIVVDLSEATDIDVTGLRVLTQGQRDAENDGRKFVLVSAVRKVRDKLEIVRAHTLFKTFHTVKEAVSFILE